MGRFASGTFFLSIIISGCLFLASCSSGNPTQVVNDSVPASISLTPSPNASLEVGKTQVFTPTARNGAGTTLTETFGYQSSDASVLTVANNGIACAGTWDSITTPTVCTPGSTGMVQLTATAQGVSSPPVSVYVHQHITNIVITRVPNQPPTLSPICFSKGALAGPESTFFQAFAFNASTDITASVGPFSWQTVASPGQSTATAVTLTAPAVGTQTCLRSPQGQCLNQESAAANTPGTSLIFASSSGVDSQPLPFETCPVQTITLAATGNPATSFVVNQGTSVTLNATVTDILKMTLTGVPLTWSSSNPASATVPANGTTSTIFGSVGTVSTPGVGGASVTASCTPPTCNGGFSPSMPIYAEGAIRFTVQSGTSAPASPTVYASSTACNTTTQTCTTRVLPLTRTSATADFTPGSPITLPFAPNSLLFDLQGTNAYLGVNNSSFGTQGLMVLTGTTATPFLGVAGKPLAVSPDGSTVVISDTSDPPNRVFICQSCNSTTSQNTTAFQFPAASAAAFSADSIARGYKAYIVSGSSCPGTGSAGCLLVFSQVDAAKIVPLNAPASDVAFIGDGVLGYIAGGDPLGTAFLPTCDDPTAAGAISGVAMPSQMIRALPDGQSAVALAVPNIQTVTASLTGTPGFGSLGCPAPRGFLNITNTVNPSASLGVGNFTPTQFLVSSDGTMAYILGNTAGSSARLPFIIAFNLATFVSSEIPLAGNATPLSASLTPGGDLLFVGADDGNVHVINTSIQLDTQQIALPFPQSSLCVGPGSPATSVETTMTITGALQSGGTTAFTYTGLSGPALQNGETVIVRGLTDFADNGTFTISALTGNTFTVANAAGVTLSGQNGTATSGTICNPDLVAVKP